MEFASSSEASFFLAFEARHFFFSVFHLVVIQVSQDVDEDGGWPLEVIDEVGNCWEVYLQHNELVLYEGGRFRHGRPMRLKGNSFANIFSHFAPEGWNGPGKSPEYDGHLDEHGWLLPEADEVQRHLEI